MSAGRRHDRFYKRGWQPRQYDNFSDDVRRRLQQVHQDEAFQAALRKAGVPEGVNTTASNSVARRYQSERPDILKSSME